MKNFLIFVFICCFIKVMGDSIKRILFVNTEMAPYVPDSEIASIGRNLPQGIQERKREIRTFMPRYGCINERKNQLHEVIRLSGMNIIISDVDRPLVIKVASISSARIQVYFIDNDDFFKRKQIYRDDNGAFFQDNDERAIFYARGILETVKKLRWEPDIIHCHGWMSHLVPLYLKKAYKDDPIFSNSKLVLSLYNDTPGEPFSPDFSKKMLFGSITEKDVDLLDKSNGTNLAKLAVSYSDAVIMAGDSVDAEVKAFCKEKGIPTLPFDGEALKNGSYVEAYNDFYDQL